MNSILTSLWIITTAVAVQLRASGKAQRRALRRLRDKDIEWSLYAHNLRQQYTQDTGHRPPDIPKILDIDDFDELMK